MWKPLSPPTIAKWNSDHFKVLVHQRGTPRPVPLLGGLYTTHWGRKTLVFGSVQRRLIVQATHCIECRTGLEIFLKEEKFRWGKQVDRSNPWIPAFAGMTIWAPFQVLR